MSSPSIIFDLDGTLIDSLPDVVAVSNRLLAEQGRRPIALAEGATMVGDGAAALIERLFAATGAPPDRPEIDRLVQRFVELYGAFPAEETIVFPGVFETLEAFAAAGVAMGVCTNKPHETTIPVLEALGLDRFFGSVIGGGALAVRKPDPAHLMAVAEAIGAERTRCVYVGDSPTDVATARNAGMRVIVVSYGYSRIPPAELGADGIIDRFADLPDAVRRLPAEEPP